MIMDLSKTNIDILNKKEAQKILSYLLIEIEQHNKNYFLLNKPTISDAEYDLLVSIAKKIQDKFPNLTDQSNIINKIQTDVREEADKVQHKVPMLSLNNAFSKEDIENFIDRTKNFLKIDYFPKICAEVKVDGVSFSIIYKNGLLDLASTRGDGFEGENITENIKEIQKIPIKVDGLPDLIEIRGEIFINKEDFHNINKQNNIFSNPRNLASGTLRQIKRNHTLKLLRYVIYGVGFSSTEIADNQYELLNFFSKKGFLTSNTVALIDNLENLQDFYDQQLLIRDNLPYEIDGVVFKINNFKLQQRLGSISKSPRFAIAYKFPEILASTKLLDVKMQVGRTGAITPIAILKKVPIGGVCISRASLHNFHNIQKKDIQIGDYVYLKRAGDVIPYVSHPDLNKRTNKTTKIETPSKCPSCFYDVLFEGEDSILRCTNKLCKEQIYHKIIHFTSALNIIGLGPKQIQKLQQMDLIHSIQDIFTLYIHREMLLTTARFGEKSINNLLQNIEKAKSTTLDKFIYALGIRHIGLVASQIIAYECETSNKILDILKSCYAAKTNQLDHYLSINGIGEKAINALYQFSQEEINITTISVLNKIMQIQPYKKKFVHSKYIGKKVVFTGTLKDLSRAEAKEQAKKLGMKVLSNISSNTDFLVHGDKTGNKLKKAIEMGIKLIDIEAWKKIALEIE